jgi:hypothetical protein
MQSDARKHHRSRRSSARVREGPGLTRKGPADHAEGIRAVQGPGVAEIGDERQAGESLEQRPSKDDRERRSCSEERPDRSGAAQAIAMPDRVGHPGDVFVGRIQPHHQEPNQPLPRRKGRCLALAAAVSTEKPAKGGSSASAASVTGRAASRVRRTSRPDNCPAVAKRLSLRSGSPGARTTARQPKAAGA